jgi:hypothetical protein
MRDDRTIPNLADPWVSRSTIHLAPVLEDSTFDPERAQLMFLPSRSLIESLQRMNRPPPSNPPRLKPILLLLAMLLILALELARV